MVAIISIVVAYTVTTLPITTEATERIMKNNEAPKNLTRLLLNRIKKLIIKHIAYLMNFCVKSSLYFNASTPEKIA
ncbi:TPA: hypothetical protein ACJGPC_004712, partial [Salmonella enterica subsp. diarizonae]